MIVWKYRLIGKLEAVELMPFFEPVDMRHRMVQWAAVLLLICLGAGMFLWNLDDLQICEQISREPLLVEAVISVEKESGLLSHYYTQYLSYTHNGIAYDRVIYRSNQNPGLWADDGETITISVDPRDPGKLAKKILNDTVIVGSILLTAAGAALAVYAAALRSGRFRRWRCRRSGKEDPDYLMDLVLLTVLFIPPAFVVPSFLFPIVFEGQLSTAFVWCCLPIAFEVAGNMAGNKKRF